MMKQYHELKTQEVLSGSALDTFRIHLIQRNADGEKTPYSIAGKSMRLIVSRVGSTAAPVLERECIAEGDYFQVSITSDDTAGWNGRYAYHFALYENGGLIRRVAYGFLEVQPVPFGSVRND